MEHRVGTRIHLETRSHLRVAEGVVTEAVVRNASLSGAFVETTARLPTLARVALRPVAARDEWLEACVVRTDGHGIGLEWLDPGVHAVQALMRRSRSRSDTSPQDDALARAHSEVASGEFDMQG